MKRVDQAHISESDRSALYAATQALRKLHPFVSHVVLFGSRARAEASPDSDIDLLVLTNRPVTRVERHAITGSLSNLGRDLGAVFSTLVVDETSWTHGIYRILPIYQEIERDGIAA